ncbi:ATP-binding protein [Aminobacter sp. MSH1]|uniref:sensor histidine kinase n=1 Tax=Aminobacter sp. MSH1 TaxID=374606 RepID=UPI00131ED2B7|nr:ATP-binding protein [Aminobacter sp. MSH1]
MAFALYSVEASRARLAGELEVTGRTLHRLISQRAAQHDAHMTSLIALTSGAEPAPLGAVRQVMESIVRFYPRIAWIALVSLGEADGGAGPATGAADAGAATGSGAEAGAGGAGAVDTGSAAEAGAAAVAGALPGAGGVRILVEVPEGGGEDLAPLRAAIGEQLRGKIGVHASSNGRYLLAKRAPAPSDAALVFGIDAALLLEPEERPAWAHLRLTLDGQELLDLPAEDDLGAGASLAPHFTAPHFAKVVDGEGQKILLSLDRPLPLDALLPLRSLLGFAALAGLASFALMFALRQRAAAQKSQQVARQAEARALLQERETLLAHASRVNAMGELASGIAHELTQPLTAVLSRSQAALRLAGAEKPDLGLISQALDVNVREAKRAGEMLKRMRDYASNKAPEPKPSALNGIVSEIVALTAADLERRGVKLELDLSAEAPEVVVDAIEMEQVLHNLIRNAADALEGAGTAGARISIATRIVGADAKIEVADNGPGIAADVLPKLFVPFFTTKADGMGLGLSLCQTLVERVDGRIEAGNGASGGARFVITLPHASARKSESIFGKHDA